MKRLIAGRLLVTKGFGDSFANSMRFRPTPSGLFVELFEGFSILSIPHLKSVCAPAVNNGRSCRRARELGILGEDKEPAFLDERAIGNELIALGYDVRKVLGQAALLQDGGGVVEHDEAVRGALATRLGPLDAAKEHSTGLSFRGGLSDWLVRFSSLLTKTTAETQNSLVLCCLSRSRMISASPM
jgi:hypothetical protein